MKTMARISPVAEQNTARLALVLPVLAQAARRASTRRACVNAAVMPLSLKLPDGFIPSYCRYRQPGLRPTYLATGSARWQSVCPSPIVITRSSGVNGKSSRNRQTPEKLSGLFRSPHFDSKCPSDFGTGSRFQSYATSNRPPHFGQWNEVSPRSTVAPHDGCMHCWKAKSGMRKSVRGETALNVADRSGNGEPARDSVGMGRFPLERWKSAWQNRS